METALVPSVRRRALPTRVLSAVALLAVLASACSSSGRPADPVTLSADVVETRAARSQARVSVALANAGADPVEVERLRLRSPAFEDVPATDRRLTVPPGQSSGRFFVPYGRPRCGRSGPHVLVVTVRTPDGAHDVDAPVTDREPGLGRLHELACAAQEVTSQAELGFGEQWERLERDGEHLLRTSLRLERRGTSGVTVTRLDGNVVFSLSVPDAATPLLVLPQGVREAELPVEVRASRCDAHALTESKRALLLSFPSFAQVDGGDEVAVPLRVPEAGEQAVLELMHDVCIAPLATTGSSPAPSR